MPSQWTPRLTLAAHMDSEGTLAWLWTELRVPGSFQWTQRGHRREQPDCVQHEGVPAPACRVPSSLLELHWGHLSGQVSPAWTPALCSRIQAFHVWTEKSMPAWLAALRRKPFGVRSH